MNQPVNKKDSYSLHNSPVPPEANKQDNSSVTPRTSNAPETEVDVMVSIPLSILKTQFPLSGRRVKPTHENPVDSIEPIDAQKTREKSSLEQNRIIQEDCKQLKTCCNDFILACTTQIKDNESKTVRFEAIQKAIITLNTHLESERDDHLKKKIKNTLMNSVQHTKHADINRFILNLKCRLLPAMTESRLENTHQDNLKVITQTNKLASACQKIIKWLPAQVISGKHKPSSDRTTLFHLSSSDHIPLMGDQMTTESEKAKQTIQSDLRRLVTSCNQFYEVCAKRTTIHESRETLPQKITEAITTLNTHLDSNISPELPIWIKQTLRSILWECFKVNHIDRSDEANTVYHNPSFMIIQLILSNTSANLKLMDTHSKKHLLYNILLHYKSTWSLYEKLTIIQLIYDPKKHGGQGVYLKINDAEHLSLFCLLVQMKYCPDYTLLLEQFCHYGLDITLAIPGYPSIMHLVIDCYAKAHKILNDYLKSNPSDLSTKSQGTTSGERKLRANERIAYTTCTQFLKFIPTLVAHEKCLSYYQELKTYASVDTSGKIIALIDTAEKNVPTQKSALNAVSTRREAILRNTPKIVTDNPVELKFLDACCHGDYHAVQEAAKTVPDFNVGFAKKNIGINTGLMHVLSKLPTMHREEKQEDPSHYFKIANYLLKHHKENLILTLTSGRSETTILDHLFNIAYYMRTDLITSLLQNPKSPNIVTGQQKVMASNLLWPYFKQTHIRKNLLKLILQYQPNLERSYTNPVPGGTILHQIVFQSSVLSKKSRMPSYENDSFITLFKCLLSQIKSKAFNQTNDDNQDVIEYAKAQEKPWDTLIEVLEHKKQALISGTDQSNPYQSESVKSKLPRKRKRKKDSSHHITSAAKKPKQIHSTPSKKQKQARFDRLVAPHQRSQDKIRPDSLVVSIPCQRLQENISPDSLVVSIPCQRPQENIRPDSLVVSIPQETIYPDSLIVSYNTFELSIPSENIIKHSSTQHAMSVQCVQQTSSHHLSPNTIGITSDPKNSDTKPNDILSRSNPKSALMGYDSESSSSSNRGATNHDCDDNQSNRSDYLLFEYSKSKVISITSPENHWDLMSHENTLFDLSTCFERQEDNLILLASAAPNRFFDKPNDELIPDTKVQKSEAICFSSNTEQSNESTIKTARKRSHSPVDPSAFNARSEKIPRLDSDNTQI